MELLTLMIIMAGVFLFILLMLAIVLALMPGRNETRMPKSESDELKKIRDEIEHEVEEEAMRDIEPLKRPRKK